MAMAVSHSICVCVSVYVFTPLLVLHSKDPGPDAPCVLLMGSLITAPRFVREFRHKQKLDHALSAGMLSILRGDPQEKKTRL